MDKIRGKITRFPAPQSQRKNRNNRGQKDDGKVEQEATKGAQRQ